MPQFLEFGRELSEFPELRSGTLPGFIDMPDCTQNPGSEFGQTDSLTSSSIRFGWYAKITRKNGNTILGALKVETYYNFSMKQDIPTPEWRSG